MLNFINIKTTIYHYYEYNETIDAIIHYFFDNIHINLHKNIAL